MTRFTTASRTWPDDLHTLLVDSALAAIETDVRYQFLVFGAAAFRSSFWRLFVRPSSCAMECRLLTREVLPPSDADIDIAGIDLDSKADSSATFGGDQCASASHERVVNQVSGVRVV